MLDPTVLLLHRPTVLVVEDEEPIRLRRILGLLATLPQTFFSGSIC